MKRHRQSPWVRVVALLLAVLALSAHAAGPGGGQAGPVSLQSPAWRDLMAQPVVWGDTLAYHAAALAGAWGRDAERAAMFDTLLLLHGQALAGNAVPLVLAGLLGQPPPDRAALQAAWDAGLNHAWAVPAWDATQPLAGHADGATPWPGRPGFWRLPGGRLAAQPVVTNRSRLVIALPGPLQLQLQTGNAPLALECKAQRGTGRWLPGESTRWWCTTPGAPASSDWGPEPQARWRAAVPSADAERDRWVDALAGRQPEAVADLAARHADCRMQLNCAKDRPPTAEERAAQHQEALAREAAERQGQARLEQKEAAATLMVSLAVALAGFGFYALCARALGTALATTIWVALAIAGAFFEMVSSRGASGWGALAMAFGVLAIAVCGSALAFFYRWLYRKLFERR